MSRFAILALSMMLVAVALMGCGGRGSSAGCTLDQFNTFNSRVKDLQTCYQINECVSVTPAGNITLDASCFSKCVQEEGFSSGCADALVNLTLCVDGKILATPPVPCDMKCQCTECGLGNIILAGGDNPCGDARKIMKASVTV